MEKKIPVIEKITQTYSCNICGKEFANKPNRYRHQKNNCRGDTVDKSELTVLSSLILQQKEQLDRLTQIVIENKLVPPINIENFNNNHISVYVTEKVDFIKVLTERFDGDEQRAINHIKNRMNQQIDGDVDLFCDIYLYGPKDKWTVSCQDKKNSLFQLKSADNKLVSDPGGLTLHQSFKESYQDTLLRLSNREICRVIDYRVGTEEFEKRRDHLLDDFDLRSVQHKIFDLCQCPPLQFIKRLSNKIDKFERSAQLNCFMN